MPGGMIRKFNKNQRAKTEFDPYATTGRADADFDPNDINRNLLRRLIYGQTYDRRAA
jgi:hypothetical protein